MPGQLDLGWIFCFQPQLRNFTISRSQPVPGQLSQTKASDFAYPRKLPDQVYPVRKCFSLPLQNSYPSIPCPSRFGRSDHQFECQSTPIATIPPPRINWSFPETLSIIPQCNFAIGTWLLPAFCPQLTREGNFTALDQFFNTSGQISSPPSRSFQPSMPSPSKFHRQLALCSQQKILFSSGLVRFLPPLHNFQCILCPKLFTVQQQLSLAACAPPCAPQRLPLPKG